MCKCVNHVQYIVPMILSVHFVSMICCQVVVKHQIIVLFVANMYVDTSRKIITFVKNLINDGSNVMSNRNIYDYQNIMKKITDLIIK